MIYSNRLGGQAATDGDLPGEGGLNVEEGIGLASKARKSEEENEMATICPRIMYSQAVLRRSGRRDARRNYTNRERRNPLK